MLGNRGDLLKHTKLISDYKQLKIGKWQHGSYYKMLCTHPETN